jgi:hypothetical protein
LNIFGLATVKDLPEVQGLVREPSWKPKKPVEEVTESVEVSQQTAE